MAVGILAHSTAGPTSRPPARSGPEVRVRLLRRLAPAVPAVLLAAALAGCAGGTDAVDQRGGSDLGFVPGNAATGVLAVDRRQAAPEVRGQLLGGTAYDLGSLRGTVTVVNVNFWGGVRLVG
jgi:hypothetical protein